MAPIGARAGLATAGRHRPVRCWRPGVTAFPGGRASALPCPLAPCARTPTPPAVALAHGSLLSTVLPTWAWFFGFGVFSEFFLGCFVVLLSL